MPRRRLFLVAAIGAAALVAAAVLLRRPPPGMVWIPGGTFVMGDPNSPDQDAPEHEVTLSGFWMDETEVTNDQFAAFVNATKYVTVAERTPTAGQFPDAPPGRLVPGGAVFVATACGDPNHCDPIWWKYVPGANWRHPTGPDSGIDGKGNYPAVQIAWEDAAAYAAWAGKRLPTEAEWERAARGGSAGPFAWGKEPPGAGGRYFANTYQGKFPEADSAADGFAGLAPVKSFPPNGYGLYDVSGNAWEWCQDWYGQAYYKFGPHSNPPGPLSGDRDGFGHAQRVRRGGSYLCSDNYCRRYLPGCRDKGPPDSGACHTGFRCAKDR